MSRSLQAQVFAAVLDRRFNQGVTDRDPRHPRIAAERIEQEERCLVMPAGSPGPVPFSDLEALGLIDHPDCHRYADDLLALNFSDDFVGADRLRVRSRVNQICQVPAPVAQGVGYTLLRACGIRGHEPPAERSSAGPPPLRTLVGYPSRTSTKRPVGLYARVYPYAYW